MDNDGSYSNVTRGSTGPLTMRVLPSNYTKGSLDAWAHPAADEPNVWVQANVTAHVTVFSGGPSDWSFSAV